MGAQLRGSLPTPAQHSRVELSPAVRRLPPGLSGPNWSSPTAAASGAGTERVEASRTHGSLNVGFSGLLSKDSRLSAEMPGRWPAQICSMRTRRCAREARKLSTFREEQTAVRGDGAERRRSCGGTAVSFLPRSQTQRLSPHREETGDLMGKTGKAKSTLSSTGSPRSHCRKPQGQKVSPTGNPFIGVELGGEDTVQALNLGT